MFVEYTFFPVGQGLFSCGKLYTDKNKKPFVWIYDCGTSSGEEKLTTAIDELNDIDEFDLVVISHFDKDHINGLEALLKNKKVKRLMLPFLSEEQKIGELSIYCSGILEHKYDIKECLTDNCISFLFNPVEFIGNLIKDSLINEKIEILFVPDRFYSTKRVLDSEEEIIYKYTEDENLNTSNVSCKIIDPHTPVICNHKWEFVPYNDVEAIEKVLSKISKKQFREKSNKIHNAATQICSLNSTKEKNAALKGLINECKSLVPVSEDRNACSLFLYAGKANLQLTNFVFSDYDEKKVNRHGILYTGDGLLSNLTQLGNLIKHIGQNRIDNIYCLQVMHHGSCKNSCSAVAKLLQPVVSVFSADPQHKNRHPDGGVVFDFMNNAPVLTDKKLQYGFYFSSHNSFPYRKWCPFW